jgi:hypothetical protein
MNLLLLFSHSLTPDQLDDARAQGIMDVIALPADLQAAFSHVPPGLPSLLAYAQPFCHFIGQYARPGDRVLIQGDFGLTYLLVDFCRQQGLTPIYATTERSVSETVNDDGSVTKKSTFRHKRFREYEAWKS